MAGTIEKLREDVQDGEIRTLLPRLFEKDAATEFTHLWSTCTLFQIASFARNKVFSDFSAIATADAKMVVDDVHCPNPVSCLV